MEQGLEQAIDQLAQQIAQDIATRNLANEHGTFIVEHNGILITLEIITGTPTELPLRELYDQMNALGISDTQIRGFVHSHPPSINSDPIAAAENLINGFPSGNDYNAYQTLANNAQTFGANRSEWENEFRAYIIDSDGVLREYEEFSQPSSQDFSSNIPEPGDPGYSDVKNELDEASNDAQVSVKVSKMIKLVHIMSLSALATLYALTSVIAYASPQRVIVGEDGKMRAGEVSTNNRYTTLTCDNITATIMAEKADNFSPSIMVTMAITNGDQKKGFRIFDVGKNKLTPEHSTSAMKLGCLTLKGGVGIDIPHDTSDELELKIQIDTKGRVFFGYDEAGLKLVGSQN